MSISHIIRGLKKIEEALAGDDKTFQELRGILTMKLACEAYERAAQGPFPILYDTPKLEEVCGYVAGAMDLVRYFEASSNNRKIRKLKGHLDLIRIGGFGLAATKHNQQNRESFIDRLISRYGFNDVDHEIRKDATRKSLELMLALAILGGFGDVEVEDPSDSSSDPNPDIIIPFQGERYGIACKSITTRHKEGLIDRIREGVDQLERSVSSGVVSKGRGIVFIDVSALLDHSRLYVPKPNYVWDRNNAYEVIKQSITFEVNKFFPQSEVSTIKKEIGHLFVGKSVAPAVLVYGHSLMISSFSEGACPFYMKSLHVWYAGDTSPVRGVLERLNKAIHCVPF